MKTIGTCSLCGGPVQMPDETVGNEKPSTDAKCANCGATVESAYDPVLKMKAIAASPLGDLRKTLEETVNRWCPKINPAAKDQPPESFEQRMAKALLNLNAFEIDYRRVYQGGKRLTDRVYPLPLPDPDAIKAIK
jgi:hypothetical protein